MMAFHHEIRFIRLLLTLPFLISCAVGNTANGITLNYLEYNRGKSFPTHADLQMDWEDSSLRLNHVRFEDDSFFPDDSIIPNAFLGPLVRLQFSKALKAFTEPYYGYRFVHFFRSNPRFGVGVEFTHLKIFSDQVQQRVSVSGIFQGRQIDEILPIGEIIDYLSVSHGVNHLNILFTYRWLLSPTPAIPDGRFQPYISFGAGPAIPHLELKLREDAPEWSEYSYQAGLGNLNFGIGAGMRYKFRPHLGCYLEYKYSHSYLNDLHFRDGAGSLEMSFATHHLMWGVSWAF